MQYCSTCFGRFLPPSSGALRNLRYPTRCPRSMACHRPWTPCWIPHPVSCHSPEAATTVSKLSRRWTQKASKTCRAILHLQINILPSCITLVLFIYISFSVYHNINSTYTVLSDTTGGRFGANKLLRTCRLIKVTIPTFPVS